MGSGPCCWWPSSTAQNQPHLSTLCRLYWQVQQHPEFNVCTSLTSSKDRINAAVLTLWMLNVIEIYGRDSMAIQRDLPLTILYKVLWKFRLFPVIHWLISGEIQTETHENTWYWHLRRDKMRSGRWESLREGISVWVLDMTVPTVNIRANGWGWQRSATGRKLSDVCGAHPKSLPLSVRQR